MRPAPSYVPIDFLGMPSKCGNTNLNCFSFLLWMISGSQLPGGFSIGDQIESTKLYKLYEGSSTLGENLHIKTYSLAHKYSKISYQQESSNLTALKNLANGKASNVIQIVDHFTHADYGIVILPAYPTCLADALEDS